MVTMVAVVAGSVMYVLRARKVEQKYGCHN